MSNVEIHRQIDLFLVRIYGIPMILVVLNQDTVADHLFAAVATEDMRICLGVASSILM